MFTHTRSRGGRLRKRSLAALAIVTTVIGPALAPASTTAQAATAAAPVTAATLTASAQHHVRVGQKSSITGTISNHRPGVAVIVQTAKGKGWHQVARSKTNGGGRFSAAWRPRHAGSYAVRIRALFPGVKPWRVSGRVDAYRAAMASYYGPGLYGSALACGGTLTPSKLGVANKTLPCGTRVTLRYRGRSVTVPVIDRGPYVAGREFDLTSATRARLGFGSTGIVWSSR